MKACKLILIGFFIICGNLIAFANTEFEGSISHLTCLDTSFTAILQFGINQENYFTDASGNPNNCPILFPSDTDIFDFKFSSINFHPDDTLRFHILNSCKEFELKYEFHLGQPIELNEMFFIDETTFVIEFVNNNQSQWSLEFEHAAYADPSLDYWCKLWTPTYKKIKNANVIFTDGQDSIICLVNSGSCNLDPEFNFEDQITIIPSKTIDNNQAVNLQDIILILKHILNIEVLQNPFSLIAADINQSGQIDMMDIIEIQRVILGVNDQSDSYKSWIFIPHCYEFKNPENPFLENYPTYECDYYHFTKPRFWGIKLGDVNLSSDGS